jgi:transcriptional regulator with XRE-family HTH domain
MIKGNRLKELRKAKGLTQGELGEMIGVKKSIVCLYEKEQRNPSIESIIDFVQIFGVTADYLLGTDCLIKTFTNKKESKIKAFTKEEVDFIEELKRHKDIYDVLVQDPKRGMELLKSKIG